MISAPALLPRLVPPAQLASASVDLAPGVDIGPLLLAEQLVEAGFTREDPVDEHGEFCVRGGIVDVFPPGDAEPLRIEFIGDTVESIRRYDPSTQRSTRTVDQARIVPIRERLGQTDNPSAADLRLESTVFEYLTFRRRPVFVVVEPDEVFAAVDTFLEQTAASYQTLTSETRTTRGAAPGSVAPPERLFVDRDTVAERLASAVRLEQLSIESDAAWTRARRNPERGMSRVSRSSSSAAACRTGSPKSAGRASSRNWWCSSPPRRPCRAHAGDRARLPDHRGAGRTRRGRPHRRAAWSPSGRLSRGFRLPAAPLSIYAETDVFDEDRRAPEQRRRSASKAFLSDLRDLKVGDYVVHVDHGIGAFVGLKQITLGPGEPQQEFMELRYHGDDKLFVPVERLDLVQKYTGASKPPVDKLGGTTWEKAKTRVKKAMRDMAEELLKLYAARKAVAGHAFAPDTHWQQEFEDAFPYDLTVDQRSAITDIKSDMETPMPMDRLLCGDVGYGKTEVAMRAAFKAVMDGKQVAVLAPTTVLAFQHLKTLRERFAGFPVRIDMVSRFRTKAEQKATLEDLAAGKVEVLVGTHRLLSKDVRVPRPRPARGGRRAALRRHAQGEDQAAAQARRRPDADGDAHSAHAEHVAGRHPRHVDHRDAAEGSAVDPDARGEVRRRGHPPRRPPRARTRRPGLRRPQPRGVDLLAGQSGHAPGAGGQSGRRPRPDGRRAARTDDARLRGAQVRRPRRHHDRRKRAGHPERQHHRHQPRRPLRPGAAVPAARPRRADPTGPRTPSC